MIIMKHLENDFEAVCKDALAASGNITEEQQENLLRDLRMRRDHPGKYVVASNTREQPLGNLKEYPLGTIFIGTLDDCQKVLKGNTTYTFDYIDPLWEGFCTRECVD